VKILLANQEPMVWTPPFQPVEMSDVDCSEGESSCSAPIEPSRGWPFHLVSKMKWLLSDPAAIDAVLADGAGRAQKMARQTMNAVKDVVGFGAS
jgi:hypothetical protein